MVFLKQKQCFGGSRFWGTKSMGLNSGNTTAWSRSLIFLRTLDLQGKSDILFEARDGALDDGERGDKSSLPRYLKSKWKPSQVTSQLVRLTRTLRWQERSSPLGLQRNLILAPHSSLSLYPFCYTSSLRTLNGVPVKFRNLYCHKNRHSTSSWTDQIVYQWLEWMNGLVQESVMKSLFFKKDLWRGIFFSSLSRLR